MKSWGVIRATDTGTNDLDSAMADFFKVLNDDAAVAEEEIKAKDSFNNHKSNIKKNTRDLK